MCSWQIKCYRWCQKTNQWRSLRFRKNSKVIELNFTNGNIPLAYILKEKKKQIVYSFLLFKEVPANQQLFIYAYVYTIDFYSVLLLH